MKILEMKVSANVWLQNATNRERATVPWVGLAARSPVVDNRTRRWYTLPVALPAAEMPRAVSRRLSPPIPWEGERFFSLL